MSIEWVAKQIQQQLAAEEANRPPAASRYNPKPPGQALAGGATEAVYALLLSKPLHWWTHSQIAKLCPCHSRAALHWALKRLRDWRRIEIAEDHSRNPRYFRYRITRRAAP